MVDKKPALIVSGRELPSGEWRQNHEGIWTYVAGKWVVQILHKTQNSYEMFVHPPRSPHRVNDNREYASIHDAKMAVDGATARALHAIFESEVIMFKGAITAQAKFKRDKFAPRELPR